MEYQRVVVARHGGPDVLEVVSASVPEPQPGEVRVRVLAAGVSYGDVLGRTGAVPDAPKPPFTPGYDVTGVVDEVGAGVESPRIGEPVTALLDAGGGYAEFVCVPADRLVPLPDGVDAVQGAAAILNYFVAYQMLHRVTRLVAGQRVLVHGAAGGVGGALVQLATLAGLQAYGTASASNHGLVAEGGAVPIDYRREDFLPRIRALTGDGVDAAFDAIGGAHFVRSYRSLSRSGHLVAYGVSRAVKNGRRNRLTAVVSFLAVQVLARMPSGRAATFYTAGGLEKRQPGSYREDMTAVLELLAAGKVRPVIAERLPLDQAAVAHERLSRGSTAGKIVLTCADQ
ncbi:MAG TPA: medium chain dehydrogenase/reductase family protein [Cryptosporangiaceae bacterium]|nr:medium chain dehydrogenase/reductase family protein [Cryptosporangiaceae bacterium]